MGAIGTVQTDQAPDNGETNVMLGYRNYGKVNYWGFEGGLKWRANDNLTLFTNYSTVSQTVFEKDDLGSLTEVGAWHLNHSKHRVKAGLTYDNGRKWNLGLSYKSMEVLKLVWVVSTLELLKAEMYTMLI